VDVGDIDGEEAEEWVEEILGCGLWVVGSFFAGLVRGRMEERGIVLSLRKETAKEKGGGGEVEATKEELPETEEGKRRDEELSQIKAFLETLARPANLDEKRYQAFVKRASKFFVRGGRLWRKETDGRHQLIIFQPDRYRLLIQAHDQLGHRGFYATRRNIADRFWWPTLDDDLKWYLKTCHECQIRSMEKVVLPPTVHMPSTPFSKVYLDTMILPKSVDGYRYLVQGRDSVLLWAEHRCLKKENERTLGAHLFEDYMCRWGPLAEIVTDNGTPWVAAVEWLAKTYKIYHIRISAYNSQSNGIIENAHRPIRDALVKICKGDMQFWNRHTSYLFWADRVTTRRILGMSPFQAATGIEPLLPFDITEATFLFPTFDSKLSDAQLIEFRATQLERREDELAAIEERVIRARFRSTADFEKRHQHVIHDYNFVAGDLVLVLNKKIEKGTNRKCRPRYFGPLVVAKRLRSGAYSSRRSEQSTLTSQICCLPSHPVPRALETDHPNHRICRSSRSRGYFG
jgi:hypothetical protein